MFLQPQKLVAVCTCLMIYWAGVCQPTLNALKIGDKIPEIDFATNFNSDYRINNLHELSGKAIILDFFNSGCLACLKGVPTMDSLQRRFKDQVQIIMITDNSNEQVKKFFTRLPKLPSLPIITNDSNFYSHLFPHDGDPLHVWIDKNGIVKAITDHYNTTESNILKLIGQDSLQVFKRPSPLNFGVDKKLLEIDKEVLIKHFAGYSMFFKPLNEYFDFTRLRIYKDAVTRMETGLTAVNYPLYALYSLAYSKELFSYPINTRNLVNNNRINIRVKNKLDLRKSTIDSVYDEWRARNLVSYELNVSSRKNFYNQLQNDLERFTPFTATIKSVVKECLVLMVSNKNLLNSIKTKELSGSSYANDNGFHILGTSLQTSLLPQLAIVYQDQPYPVVDETSFFHPVNMKITANFDNINRLNRQLSNYGLILKKELRKIKSLLIEDKSK